MEMIKAVALLNKDYTDEETDESVMKKRQHLYQELVKTEQDYIDDLKIVIDVSTGLLLKTML